MSVSGSNAYQGIERRVMFWLWPVRLIGIYQSLDWLLELNSKPGFLATGVAALVCLFTFELGVYATTFRSRVRREREAKAFLYVLLRLIWWPGTLWLIIAGTIWLVRLAGTLLGVPA